MDEDKELIIFIPSIEDGGVEKNLFLITNYITKKIKNISIISYDKNSQKNFKKSIKFHTPLINYFNYNSRYPKYFFCLISLFFKILKNSNCTVLSFQANIFAIILCKCLNVQIISRSNSSSAGWSKNFFKQIIFSYFFPKADKIIVNSYDFKREMDNKYKIKTECILNPFDFSEIKKKSNKKIKNPFFKKDCLKIISIGRLTQQKDFITLLKAVKICKRKFQLIILGKGKEYLNLKNFIDDNQLNRSVKIYGYKKNPFPYIKYSDVFVLSSLFEGSPNVLVEAQYLKKYIFSTSCPTGPKEILKNGTYGDLYKIGDYKKLAYLLDNFRYTSRNKKKVADGYTNCLKYSHKINCEKYYQLINRFL